MTLKRTGIGLLAAAGLLVLPSCSSPRIDEDRTDVETLAEQEAFVAETIADLEDFPGFEVREIELDNCYYGMHDDQIAENGARVDLIYRFPEALAEDPAAVDELVAQIETRWLELGHEVQREFAGDGSFWTVRARGEEVAAKLFFRNVPTLEFTSGCVLIADGEFTIPDPVGGVTPENDSFKDYSPRSNPVD